MDSFKQKISAAREGGVRNQVSGMFSRDKPHQSTHAPRPINELRDPMSFEPPPRRRTNPSQPPLPPSQTDRAPPPLPSSRPSQSPPVPQAGSRPAPPALPPRLPPRSKPATPTPTSPATTDPYLNQSALSRLGASGISVPDLGINARSSASHSPDPPSQGTTWAQKKAALQTASDFQRDPRSVSLSDARGAAATANNFRQRHGEQVAAGARAADGLNQKYGIAERVAAHSGSPASGSSGQGGSGGGVGGAVSALGGLAKKKPPPPPPPKRGSSGVGAGAGASVGGDGAPPPLPLGTKPRFD